ncbi:NAD(P)-binding protein [Xylariomycetidae sp. FL2044]|nr:NAD(P)-binding protein [Xylariomycetidae sp. FL2044]
MIGAGARVGKSCADAFAAAGYRVAIASRTEKPELSKYKFFAYDAEKPDTTVDLFCKVRAEVGVPSVVIYNAYNSSNSQFGSSIAFQAGDAESLQRMMNPNALSPYIAAREAVGGFEELHAAGKLGNEGATFIYTGNALDSTAAPGMMLFGLGKGVGANMIRHLALGSFMDKPYKFYYGDERHPDGRPKFTGLSGESHAKMYFELAQDPKQGPWYRTFIDGKYVKLPEIDSILPAAWKDRLPSAFDFSGGKFTYQVSEDVTYEGYVF